MRVVGGERRLGSGGEIGELEDWLLRWLRCRSVSSKSLRCRAGATRIRRICSGSVGLPCRRRDQPEIEMVPVSENENKIKAISTSFLPYNATAVKNETYSR